MYLRTGGGHLAPARAVAGYISRNYGERYEAVLIDGLTDASRAVKFIVEDGYRLLQNRAKWYYEFLYGVNKITGLVKFNNYMLTRAIKPFLKEKILSEKPGKIILFHFFLIDPVQKILKENNLAIPLVIVVTDPFTAHPVWFLNKSAEFIVFSSKLKEYAIKKGVKENRIHQFPFILDEKYSSIFSKDEVIELKDRYGFDQNRKIVLIVGGGDGIPKGEAILRRIMKEVNDSEVAIVCGRNKELFNFAMRLKEKEHYNNLKVFGYIDFIYELINLSDLIITKCGASTFMEILLLKKLPIVNSYIWEQEKGNVDYLVNNRLGIFEKEVHKLPSLINRLIIDDTLYNSYIGNIDNASFENGTRKVCDFIADKFLTVS